MRKNIFLLLAIHAMTTVTVYAQQKQVSITMDDLPMAVWSDETPLKTIEQANNKLLETITRKQTPVTIFINESQLIKTGQTDQRIALLKKWIDNPYVLAGNHTYTHAKYSETTFEAFQEEILKGEVITRKLLEGTGKSLSYFRFPYNATGKDSLTRTTMEKFLVGKGYIPTPFTIESSDYLFNALYQDALNKKDAAKASKIGEAYVNYTVYSFEYYEKLSQSLYNRLIPQIYLCHDNALNADYLPKLIDALRKKQYTFVDLPTVLKDDVYKQPDYYYGPYGFSWFYRWVQDPAKRKALLREQPDPPQEISTAFENLK